MFKLDQVEISPHLTLSQNSKILMGPLMQTGLETLLAYASLCNLIQHLNIRQYRIPTTMVANKSAKMARFYPL
jgi:hypothetical protein